jgi:DNA-3-methyladenine glycosylase II
MIDVLARTSARDGSILILVSVPCVTVRVSVIEWSERWQHRWPSSRSWARGRWRPAGGSGRASPPAALAPDPAGPGLRTVFCAEGDWRRAEAEVTQAGETARVVLAGDGDLDAAAGQVCRFLALDVDGRGWPQVGRRDPVIAGAQARLPGLRPCGFHSPYEAAAWSVLAQRLRIVQAARLRAELIARHGQDGAFPPPHTLARAGLDLPGRKGEYLRAVAEAALDGLLDGAALRALDADDAVQRVQQVKGLGPFAAELVVVRGANAPDALPHHERRLDAEIAEQYGPGRTLAEVSQAWRP